MVSPEDVIEVIRKKLFKYDGVSGVFTEGNSIVVCATKRLPDDFPDNIAGFDIKVAPIPQFSLHQTGRYRPIIGGISGAVSYVTAGTLGGIFRDKSTGNPVVVSNAHVIANAQKIIASARVGDTILQPGGYDGGELGRDDIGYLIKWANIKGSGNYIDCAKGSIEVDYKPQILWGNTTKQVKGFKDVSSLHPGDKVYKSGRTTGITSGTVVSTSYSGVVNYGGKPAEFIRQILIAGDNGPFSQGGDSGSLVLDKDDYVVGLLFAGDDQYTVANPIKNVVRFLDLDVIEYDEKGQPVETKTGGYIDAIPLILLGATLYSLR